MAILGSQLEGMDGRSRMGQAGWRSLIAGATAVNGAGLGFVLFGPVGAVVGAIVGGVGSMVMTDAVVSEESTSGEPTKGPKASDPGKYFSCFISYSSQDEDFAKRLYADLQAHGVRCWFAPNDVVGGRKLNEQIDEAIAGYDRLLLVLSRNSMKSEWVKTEIAKARKREMQEHRQILFPIRLVEFQEIRDWECWDGDIGKDSAREIREYFVLDFSSWQDQSGYNTAFERLLKSLIRNST